MIKLNYWCNEVFVYSADDWLKLRKVHRIIAEPFGNINCIPTLPAKLLPEETLLLIENGIAQVVEYEFSSDQKEEFRKFEEEMFEQQQILHKNNRKKQLETMIDKIVEAKRQKGDNRLSEEILNEELEKSSKITKENMIWPIFLVPLVKEVSFKEVSRELIIQKTTVLKYKTFKDLWEKGYYITSGHKFGGDFLVYKGDPILFHAIFIVRCAKDVNEPIEPAEIVAFGRLGTSVRKRAVLAFLDNEQVSYITINWIDA